MDIGNKIKKMREQRNMSQEELAKRVGYTSRSSINKIEKDGRGIPSDKIVEFAKVFNVSPAYLMGWEDEEDTKEFLPASKKGVRIPVLGRVAAGIPIEAITDILDYEEITKEMASKGEYFGLEIKGNSMLPRMEDGDVVIVKKQEDVESGDIAVVLVNGEDATVKKIVKSEAGIMLVASNQAVFEPTFYTNQQIEELPISILGKVVELRGKF